MSSGVALVTGAGGGIGGASADALEAAGMAVARTDLPLDVADEAAVSGLVERTEAELGLGEASDVANAAVYLASRESEFVTGVNLALDGGGSAARGLTLG